MQVELFFWLGIVSTICGGFVSAAALVYVFDGKKIRRHIREDW